MHTIRLIYASDAREGLGYRDFLDIMDKAAATNRDRSITGILCHSGGKFLQALEGERSAVNALYRSICTDPRHANCELLGVEDIDTRDFAEWSMKIVDWSDAATAERQAAAHAGSPALDPSRMNGQQAAAFLRDVAAAERQLLE